MPKKNLGYTKPLFILAFDHRSSFRKLLGIQDRKPTEAEIAKIQELKMLIYQGFKLAVQSGKIPQTAAAILVDEEYGAQVARQALKEGFRFAMPVEKSGQKEFDFEYGSDFAEHINNFAPTFVKVLVRYNPEGNQELNQQQIGRLKVLSDWCRQNNKNFLFELLVPATAEQLAQVDNNKQRYDEELRPNLMIQAIKELQEAGIEPDIWKLEGLRQRQSYQLLTNQIRSSPNRQAVSVVVLGRGESEKAVKEWLAAARGLEGVIGFAVGRTIFTDSLESLSRGQINTEQAVKLISSNYSELYSFFGKSNKSRYN